MSESALTKFEEIVDNLVKRSNIRQAIAAVKSPKHSIDWVGTAEVALPKS